MHGHCPLACAIEGARQGTVRLNKLRSSGLHRTNDNDKKGRHQMSLVESSIAVHKVPYMERTNPQSLT